MPPVVASAAHPGVILVCADTPGIGCPADWDYRTIQEAVDHAKANDWILVWPGDYREHGNTSVDHSAGLWIESTPLHPKDGIFIRGMDGRQTVVDGTLKGPECSSAAENQNYGPRDDHGNQVGRDGVVIWKTENTWLENLSVCNFLTGKNGGHGNEIWWNGGDGSGQIGMHNYWGDYLNATSTYSNGNNDPRGQYGIFSSNSGGKETDQYTGFMNHSYANNMADAAFYIGACPNCTQVLENSHGQNSSLGFSGTNAGGNFVIRNTEFDHNKTGLTSNSQNNDDQPSPQIGTCPSGFSPPVPDGSGCTVFEFNHIHDNNNPNVPGVGSGLSGGAPVGTGIVLAGTRFTTLYQNEVDHNGAWGILVADLPDNNETPPSYATYCNGGVGDSTTGVCWYQAYGNATIQNTLHDNGTFGNPTNGDLALFDLHAPPDDPTQPGNCFSGNVDPNRPLNQPSSDPVTIQVAPYSQCGNPPAQNPGNPDPVLAAEANCAGGILAQCPNNPAATYPRQSENGPTLMSLDQTRSQSMSMANPCGPDSWGEAPPPNPWCPATAVNPQPTPNGNVSAATQPGLPQTGARVSSPQSIPLTAAALPLLPLAMLAVLGAGRARRRRTVALRRPPD